MELTQEQKDKVEKILREEVLCARKTANLIDNTIQHIKELVGSDWIVMYKPVDECKDPRASVEFVIANKERFYTISIKPSEWVMEDKEW